MSDVDLTGKVAVVTGAGQGMGRATTRLLSERGASVAALDVNESGAAETIEGVAGPALALACDVSVSTAVNQSFEKIEAEFGPISVLVNNAGIGRAPNDGSDEMYALMAKRNAELESGSVAETHVDHLVHMQDDGWRGVLEVNLDGVFYCTRAAVRSMANADISGSIISMTSTSAQSGEGPLHYVTSKAAIVGFTRGLARELGSRRIRVNAVAPGPTNTPIMDGIPEDWIKSMESSIPLGRMAEPEEIAQAVCWLASDASIMCTGSVLVANGGSYFF